MGLRRRWVCPATRALAVVSPAAFEALRWSPTSRSSSPCSGSPTAPARRRRARSRASPRRWILTPDGVEELAERTATLDSVDGAQAGSIPQSAAGSSRWSLGLRSRPWKSGLTPTGRCGSSLISGAQRQPPDIAPIAEIEPGEALTLELQRLMDGQVTSGPTHGRRFRRVRAGLHVSDWAGGGARWPSPATARVRDPGRCTSPGFWLDGRPSGRRRPGRPRRAAIPRLLGDRRRCSPVGRPPGCGHPGSYARRRDRRRAVAGAVPRGAPTRGRPGERGPPDPHAGPGHRLPGAGPRRALRTTPPRENGGNMDVRDLTEGARLLLPVHAAGGLLSAGDLHFAQGDGEVSLYAIETNGSVTFRVGLRKSPGWLPPLPGLRGPGAPDPRCLRQPASPSATGRQPLARHRPGDPACAGRADRLAARQRLRLCAGAGVLLSRLRAADRCRRSTCRTRSSAALPLDVFDAIAYPSAAGDD